MNAYKNTQIGYVIIIIFGVVVLVTLYENWGNFTLSTAFLHIFPFLVVSMFMTLTIRIRENTLQWFFGPKVWCKAVYLPDIVDTKVVKSNRWFGFAGRNGWRFYNVAGRHALELSLKNGKKIRLGTDEPEKLQAAIAAQTSS